MEKRPGEEGVGIFLIDRAGEGRHARFMFAAFVLLFAVVAWRVASGFLGGGSFEWLHNFAPLAAVALCGAVYLPRRLAFALPLAMLFISNAILNLAVYHEALFSLDMLPPYAALALIAAIGFTLRQRARVSVLVGASIGSSLLFYVITNTGSWIANAAYAKTFAGWTQALTTGLPGFPPTWWFLRNTLLSDLLFTLLFAGCMALQARKSPALVASPREELAPW